MSACTHFKRHARNGRRLHHAPETEQQICRGLAMDPDELVAWARNSPLTASPLREESMVFLMVQHRSASRHLLLVEELAGTLDARIRCETTRRYLPVLGASGTEEIVREVASLAWIVMLQSEKRRIWAEICFHRFVLNLGRDVLRMLREQKTVSLDTDNTARTAALAVAGQGASPEEMIYLREVLSEMKPLQREAFLLHHVNEPQRAIAKAVGRSDRSVRTWLKHTEHRLQAGF